MSKRIIACPKCKKKYQVTTEMSGKKMKCPACSAQFVLQFKSSATKQPAAKVEKVPPRTPQSAGKSAGPSQDDFKKLGLDGPLQREAELFPESNTPTQGQVVLENYAADAGFGYVDPNRFVVDPGNQVDENPLLANPALTHAQQLAAEIRADNIDEEHDKEEEERKQSFMTVIALSVLLCVFTIVLGVLLITGVIPRPVTGWMIFTLFGIFQIAGAVYYVMFLVRGFERTPTFEVLLAMFVPMYVVVYLIRFWKDVGYEAMSWIILSAGMFVAALLLVATIIIGAMIDPTMMQNA